ncbi:tyrosine-type recombinase/integrase [Aliiglaciecola lipolytica]|uniref:Phage integrase family protein n=1 Tax=Aliiglaciecola lipolytica E3 TaxID=1127673 RepID=K6XPX8_9ALTE|nr:tyrosine-type recombinase/integrase [Aliiglaciecola lipolytica]GAC13731.1 phage integrase family protein [Aliiglaciecola lipolytica E3]
MAKYTARHDINDTLYIYKQDNSERWYVRFRFEQDTKWRTKSTKKKDKDEAIAMAHRIYLDQEIRFEAGTLIESKRFKHIADNVIDKLEAEFAMKQALRSKQVPPEKLVDYIEANDRIGSKRQDNDPVFHDYSRALKNYHIPYFGKKYITNVDQEAISEFDEWRANKLGRKPASSTLQTHNAALQLVFKEAIERRWMIAAQVPVLSSKGESGTRRAAFSEEEYEVVLEGIYESESNAHTEKTRQIRELLYDYCEIAVNTGIRPGTEMEAITWGDIELRSQNEKAQFFIHVRKGKTTKHTGTRKVVCKKDVIGALIRLRKRFPNRKPTDILMRLASGESTPQLSKAFEKVLQRENLKQSPMGPRTLYSLRHTYITWQLLNGQTMDVIAKQCGTSVAMIEQHYSHVKPEMFAVALSGVTFDKEKPLPKSKKRQTVDSKNMERDEKRFKEWAAEYKTRGCI